MAINNWVIIILLSHVPYINPESEYLANDKCFVVLFIFPKK